MAPRQIRETCIPVEPRRVYCIERADAIALLAVFKSSTKTDLVGVDDADLHIDSF